MSVLSIFTLIPDSIWWIMAFFIWFISYTVYLIFYFMWVVISWIWFITIYVPYSVMTYIIFKTYLLIPFWYLFYAVFYVISTLFMVVSFALSAVMFVCKPVMILTSIITYVTTPLVYLLYYLLFYALLILIVLYHTNPEVERDVDQLATKLSRILDDVGDDINNFASHVHEEMIEAVKRFRGNYFLEKLIDLGLINDLRADNSRQQTAYHSQMDEKEFVQATQQISGLLTKVDSNNVDYISRRKLYIEAKKIYKQQNAPVYIHKNVKQKIQNNKQKYNKTNALPFTLTMDKDFKTFNSDKYKREFATKMNIPISSIEIISVTEGSTIVHQNLHAFEKNGTKYTVGAIAEKMSATEAAKKLVEFGVFLAEFGEPINTFKPLQQHIVMNPKWNRIYGPGHIEWEGTLNNDKTEPYYCPRGWKKYTCKVTDTSEDFDAKYKSWPVAYHGTKFSASMMISFSRLRVGGQPDVKNTSGADCFGTGLYFSPSIEYAAHPLYASPKKMSNNAREHAGKWVQVVLNCRIKPGCWSVHQATIGDTSQQIDPNYKNSELEWLVHAPQGTHLDESQVVFCGYMFRVTDNDPRQLTSSKWWELDAYGKYVEKWYEK